MFCLQQNQRTKGQNRFCLGGGQIMYTHVSKYKNDKIKKKKRKETGTGSQRG
jgi:hypothetical protein